MWCGIVFTLYKRGTPTVTTARTRAHTRWRYSLLEPLARLEQAPCGHAAGELALAAVDHLLQQAPPRAVLLVEHLHRAGPRRLLGAVPASRARRHGLRRVGSSEAAFSARACPRLPPSGPTRAGRPPRPCSPPRPCTSALHQGPAPRPCSRHEPELAEAPAHVALVDVLDQPLERLQLRRARRVRIGGVLCRGEGVGVAPCVALRAGAQGVRGLEPRHCVACEAWRATPSLVRPRPTRDTLAHSGRPRLLGCPPALRRRRGRARGGRSRARAGR